MLGLDPLYVANEGKLIAVVPPEDAERLLRGDARAIRWGGTPPSSARSSPIIPAWSSCDRWSAASASSPCWPENNCRGSVDVEALITPSYAMATFELPGRVPPERSYRWPKQPSSLRAQDAAGAGGQGGPRPLDHRRPGLRRRLGLHHRRHAAQHRRRRSWAPFPACPRSTCTTRCWPTRTATSS